MGSASPKGNLQICENKKKKKKKRTQRNVRCYLTALKHAEYSDRCSIAHGITPLMLIPRDLRAIIRSIDEDPGRAPHFRLCL